ncbi:MAG: hypothetical protein COA79_19970 [Planctomycetota bacterium]|nr:MAG: hypothetical protein COA79_19970 [Planctomycetota bacterium]
MPEFMKPEFTSRALKFRDYFCWERRQLAGLSFSHEKTIKGKNILNHKFYIVHFSNLFFPGSAGSLPA